MPRIEKILQRKNSGFTLMELLIVMIILVVLMAFIVPIVINQMGQARIRQARLQLNAFDQALTTFRAERGYYPQGRADVPRSGLAVLAGEQNPYTPQQQGSQLQGTAMGMGGLDNMGGSMGGPAGMTGTNPAMPSGFGNTPPGPGNDPTRGVGGSLDGGALGGPGNMGAPAPIEGVGVGGALGGPGTMDGAGTMGSIPGPAGMNTPPGGLGAMPGTPSVTGGPGQPSDLAGFDSKHGAGASQNYLGKSLPKDPWGNEYFYEYPTNRRPTNNTVPAIWSAGPDGKSGTDDDIVNWEDERLEMEQDPVKKAEYEARMRQQGGQMGGPSAPGVPGVPGMGMGGMGPMPGNNVGTGGMGAMPGNNMEMGGENRPNPPMPGSGGMGNPPATNPMPAMPANPMPNPPANPMPNPPAANPMPNPPRT